MNPLRALPLLLLAISPPDSEALVIRGYDPATHDRFSSGYPSNPVESAAFFQSTLDWSGIGWDDSNSNRSVSLISPQHFVGANHYRIAVGETVNFLGADGVLRGYTVAANHAIPNDAGDATDIYVGELSAPIAAADMVSYFRVPDLTLEAQYVGQSTLLYGRTARMGTGMIESFLDFGGSTPITGSSVINETRGFQYTYNNVGGFVGEAHYEGGDSGSAAFIISNNSPLIVGTHSVIATTAFSTTNIDTFLPHYTDEINTVMSSSGFQLEVIPEPSRALLLLLGALAVVLPRRR